MIPCCFLSWHHINWSKGTFGSLYEDYVFTLLAESNDEKRNQNQQWQSSRNAEIKEAAVLTYLLGQDSASYHEKIKSEITGKGH